MKKILFLLSLTIGALALSYGSLLGFGDTTPDIAWLELNGHSYLPIYEDFYVDVSDLDLTAISKMDLPSVSTYQTEFDYDLPALCPLQVKINARPYDPTLDLEASDALSLNVTNDQLEAYEVMTDRKSVV